MTLPRNMEDVQKVLLQLTPRNFAFKVEFGELVYWVWRFRWKSAKWDTIIVRLPPNREDPDWKMEITDMLPGTPDEAAVRAHLQGIAPA